jgi:hypothetical protein
MTAQEMSLLLPLLELKGSALTYYQSLVDQKKEEAARVAGREQLRQRYSSFSSGELEKMVKLGLCEEDKDIVSQVIKEKKAAEVEAKVAERASASLATRIQSNRRTRSSAQLDGDSSSAQLDTDITTDKTSSHDPTEDMESTAGQQAKRRGKKKIKRGKSHPRATAEGGGGTIEAGQGEP